MRLEVQPDASGLTLSSNLAILSRQSSKFRLTRLSEGLWTQIETSFMFRLLTLCEERFKHRRWITPDPNNLPRHFLLRKGTCNLKLTFSDFGLHVKIWCWASNRGELVPKAVIESFAIRRQVNDDLSGVVCLADPIIDILLFG